MVNKIYVVVEDEWETEVCEVFLNKEKADLYAKKHNCKVREFEPYDDKIKENKDKKLVQMEYSRGEYSVTISESIEDDEGSIKDGIYINSPFIFDNRTLVSLNCFKTVSCDKIQTEKTYKEILESMVTEAKDMIDSYKRLVYKCDNGLEIPLNKNAINHHEIEKIENALYQKYFNKEEE